MVNRVVVLTVAGLLCAALAHAQQGHGYTPADIENGGLLYQANCTACHGPDGDGVPSINLGSGKFRRGTTDDEIVKIILGGIPGTAMPPSSFSEGQAGTIVAYLRSLADSPSKGMLSGQRRARPGPVHRQGAVSELSQRGRHRVAQRAIAQRDRGVAPRDRAAAIDRRTERRHPIGSSAGSGHDA